MEGCQRLPDLFRTAAARLRQETASVDPPLVTNQDTANASEVGGEEWPEVRGGESASASSIGILPVVSGGMGRKSLKECPEELKGPIADLEKKLRYKAAGLTGQNST